MGGAGTLPPWVPTQGAESQRPTFRGFFLFMRTYYVFMGFVADSLETNLLPICVITSNLVVLRQRVYAQI